MTGELAGTQLAAEVEGDEATENVRLDNERSPKDATGQPSNEELIVQPSGPKSLKRRVVIAVELTWYTTVQV